MIDKHAIIHSGDFNRCFLSIKEVIDRWAALAGRSVVSQKVLSGTSTSTDVSLHQFQVISQLGYDTRLQAISSPLQEPHAGMEIVQLTNIDIPTDGRSSRDISTSEWNIDWDDTSRNEPFYGRVTELHTLHQWMIEKQCRVIAILGMGGIGKTSLAVALVDQVKASFSCIFWRSLRNAPPFSHVLQDCVQFISAWQETDLPESVDDQILLLLEYLRRRRCLIVLDNMEAIMLARDNAGKYRKDYEAYGRLLEIVGREKHQSCFLLTSREKPQDIAYFEGKTSPVRSYPLKGLKVADGQKVLKEKALRGAKQVRESLIRRYAGNPLALKLVSQLIRELFEGNIATFLKEGEAIFEDIRDVIDQQFERLSALERELMYWLSIEREPVSLDRLQQDLIGPITKRDIQEALRSLLRRNLIEAGNNIFFQNVVMEYMTDRFVESIVEEISSEKILLFDRHALIKAQTKDYVRESQVRLILTPVVQRVTSLGSESIELKCQRILALLRKDPAHQLGYAAGNVLNILLTQGYNLRGYDFAHLPIRQAYLKGKELADISFAYAHFMQCVFTDIFGCIVTLAFSPNGELLAIRTVNGEVKVWNVLEGIPVLVCAGHTAWLRTVVFSPDGRLLASSSYDHTVRLWDVSNGKCLHVLNALSMALGLGEQRCTPILFN
jgi:hypothetical protein